jgi:hypothetical protein
MEAKDCSELTNSELKLYIQSLENEFSAIKAKIKLLCEDMEKIESQYELAQNEINLRKTIF